MLPRFATPLIGRDAELLELEALLASPSMRLLTITGTGGSGKTRLAIECASQGRHRYPDGVHFVSLVPVRNPRHVLPAIARGIGIQISDHGSAIEQLVISLHEQRALLLLDNFEQVIDAGPAIGELAAACPRLTVVVTSRAPLRLEAETIFQTTPLSVEMGADSATTRSLRIPAAVELFAERARRVDTGFQIDVANLATVLEICQRLDGLPLAIELAAARLRTVSPRELLERLDPRLPVLTDGNRDLPERQRTMRAAIAWSYELLGEEERRLFRWLSVFVGGFRLPAAESMARAMQRTEPAQSNPGAKLLDSMTVLLESNLLYRSPGPRTEHRYAMLEVVREFGLELLEAHHESAAARSSHIAWCASIREWLDPNRFAPHERFVDHLWAIDAEHPNIRTALARCEASGDFESMLEIAGAAAVFWHHRGFLSEGRAWLELAIRQATDAPAESRCWALAGLGLIVWTQGDPESAAPYLEEALALANRLDHLELRALSLHVLALVDVDRGIAERARDRIEAALALWRILELPSDEAMALHILSGLPSRPGEADERMSNALRCLALFESIGHPGGVAFAQHRIGRLIHETGDDRRAFGHYARAVATWLSIDDHWALNRSLVMLAEMALVHNHPGTAATLIGVVDAHRRLSSSELPIIYQSTLDRLAQALESTLGSEAFLESRRAGSALTTDEINGMIAHLERRLFERSLLSHRELEVLQRMAAGETDREIADQLFLSPRTVHSHVSHILTKLDAGSRREAVRHGRELGLIDSDATLR